MNFPITFDAKLGNKDVIITANIDISDVKREYTPELHTDRFGDPGHQEQIDFYFSIDFSDVFITFVETQEEMTVKNHMNDQIKELIEDEVWENHSEKIYDWYFM